VTPRIPLPPLGVFTSGRAGFSMPFTVVATGF
jgi:hypothetical protein